MTQALKQEAAHLEGPEGLAFHINAVRAKMEDKRAKDLSELVRRQPAHTVNSSVSYCGS